MPAGTAAHFRETFYPWKERYTGLEVDRVRQLTQLQEIWPQQKQPETHLEVGTEKGDRSQPGELVFTLVQFSGARSLGLANVQARR